MHGSFDVDAFRRALEDVTDERVRQLEKFGRQNLEDGTDKTNELGAFIAREMCNAATEAGCVTWLDVLREEVEEVSAETDPTRLRAELVQVAAVCVAWLEALDRRTGKKGNRS